VLGNAIDVMKKKGCPVTKKRKKKGNVLSKRRRRPREGERLFQKGGKRKGGPQKEGDVKLFFNFGGKRSFKTLKRNSHWALARRLKEKEERGKKQPRNEVGKKRGNS